jgi:hypothetical protein
LNSNQHWTLVITFRVKLFTSETIFSGSIKLFKLDFLAVKPRLDHKPLFFQVNDLGVHFGNVLQINFGLILTFKKPVEVLLLLPFLLKRGRYLAQLLDFSDKSKEFRALHIGQRVVEVGGESLDQGDDEVVKISQLLLGVGEEMI